MKTQIISLTVLVALIAGCAVSPEAPLSPSLIATSEARVTEQSRQLTDRLSVSPQISAADVEIAAANGVKLIINNRPDGEAIGQPKSAEIEAAATAAGISYVHIPVGRTGITPEHIAAFDQAMATVEDDAQVLAFCRSGMRSTLVRSYSAANKGQTASEIISEAQAAGYDIQGQAPNLEALAATK